MIITNSQPIIVRKPLLIRSVDENILQNPTLGSRFLQYPYSSFTQRKLFRNVTGLIIDPVDKTALYLISIHRHSPTYWRSATAVEVMPHDATETWERATRAPSPPPQHKDHPGTRMVSCTSPESGAIHVRAIARVPDGPAGQEFRLQPVGSATKLSGSGRSADDSRYGGRGRHRERPLNQASTFAADFRPPCASARRRSTMCG